MEAEEDIKNILVPEQRGKIFKVSTGLRKDSNKSTVGPVRVPVRQVKAPVRPVQVKKITAKPGTNHIIQSVGQGKPVLVKVYKQTVKPVSTPSKLLVSSEVLNNMKTIFSVAKPGISLLLLLSLLLFSRNVKVKCFLHITKHDKQYNKHGNIVISINLVLLVNNLLLIVISPCLPKL